MCSPTSTHIGGGRGGGAGVVLRNTSSSSCSITSHHSDLLETPPPPPPPTSAAGSGSGTSTSVAVVGLGGGNGNASSSSSAQLIRLYQTFIFSVPISFTLVLLSLFFLFYVRRHRRHPPPPRRPPHWTFSSFFRAASSSEESDSAEIDGGLKKEVRELLPVIVYQQSFCVKDTQCSVCLGDYEAEERLQQIPACGHTFHMDCIDSWLSTQATCPLCRQSLLASAKASSDHEEAPDHHVQLERNDT